MSCRKVGPLYDHEVAQTLTDSLIDVADDVRQLFTDFGQRPYRIFLVWVRWTADEDGDGMFQNGEELLVDGEIGVGRPIVVQEIEILPTPMVSLGGVGKRYDATGVTEAGSISVTEISMSFSEDVLMGLLPEYRDPDHPDTLAQGIEFFWELRDVRPAGYVSPGFEGQVAPQDMPLPRRRFHITGTPNRNTDQFFWAVNLGRADGERSRQGSVEALR